MFNRWAEHTRVRDEWLLEAAWQTLCVWSKGSLLDRDPAKTWFCYAPEVHVPNFQPCLTEPRPAITAPFGVSSRAEGALRIFFPLPETPQQFASVVRHK